MSLLFAYGKNRFSHDVAHTLCVRTAKSLARLRGCAVANVINAFFTPISSLKVTKTEMS